MPTTFYLRNADIGVNNYMLGALQRGASVTTLTINTTSGGTDISGGFFATAPLAAFTLSGSVTVSCRASESNNTANSGMRYRLYKWSPSGGLSSALLTLTQGAELTTTNSTVSLSGTPTSTAFANGDVLVVEVAITNVGGTMGSGRTVDVTYNGATANATGDSFFTINENVVLKQRATATG
jgi:hypothetical protein